MIISGQSNNMKWNRWSEAVQEKTEDLLTWRKLRKIKKKEKRKKKNPILDWVEAILSAVLIVLLINQFLVQAYQIPSQSMVTTLKIGDRIFVNKFIYGPELLPGIIKIRGFRTPRRGEVIIFENPSYIPIGPVKDILQRIIYMLTLSMVDIDRDEFGKPKHHFLIKRAIAMAGDRVRIKEGEVEILPPGEADWIPEEDLKAQLGLDYPVRRLFSPDEYGYFRDTGVGLALMDSGIPLAPRFEKAIKRNYYIDKAGGAVSWTQKKLVDNAYIEKWRYRTLYALKPYNRNFQNQWRLLENGWYIPERRLFPMGDNRDDSRDARYFGPVRIEKVLGRAMFKYWPFSRFGSIR